MGRNTKWTEELKNELLGFFKEEEKGNKSVNEIAETFAQKYGNMTASQVKSAYYKFYNDNNTKNGQKVDGRTTWSNKENEMLLKAVQNKKGTLTSVFEEFAKNTNRSAQNVSQHYYFLMRSSQNQNNANNNSKKNDAKPQKLNAKQQNNNASKNKSQQYQFDFSALMKGIKKMPPEAIQGIYHIVNASNKDA